MKIIEYQKEDIVVTVSPVGDCTLITKYGKYKCKENVLPNYIRKFAKVNDHMNPWPYFYGIFPYQINSKCVVYLKNPLPGSAGKHDASLVPKGLPFNKERLIKEYPHLVIIHENSIILPYNIPYSPIALERIIYKHASRFY